MTNLLIVNDAGQKTRPISGMPDVDYGGQGGLGDVALHPDFANNGYIYLSYAESGPGRTRGAAVARAVLNETNGGGYLSGFEVVWRQYPKVVGYGHYAHRIRFDDKGFLFISSGDRQKFTPAQDMQANIGKIVRLHDDGSVPEDNPFVDYYDQNPLVDDEGVYPQIWSLGHRNPLGIAFDLDGQLWNIEMGPAGGDELNRVVKGANYGYPVVSNGDHYDGREIPDHDTRPEFSAPASGAALTPLLERMQLGVDVLRGQMARREAIEQAAHHRDGVVGREPQAEPRASWISALVYERPGLLEAEEPHRDRRAQALLRNHLDGSFVIDDGNRSQVVAPAHVLAHARVALRRLEEREHRLVPANHLRGVDDRVPDFRTRGRVLIQRFAYLGEHVEMLLEGMRKAGLEIAAY